MMKLNLEKQKTQPKHSKKLIEEKWDMIILDIDMPGKKSLEILKNIKNNKRKIPALVFSLHSEDQIALRAYKLGAYGYLSKDKAGSELLVAVKLVLSGKRYVSAEIAQKMVLQLENPSDKAPHELLSDREDQTLLLFAKGKTGAQIATNLSLSEPTISTYRSRS